MRWKTPKKVAAKMEELRVADAITEIFVLFKRCNKYIDETMPWALAKDEAKTGPPGNSSVQPGREHQHRRYHSWSRLCRKPQTRFWHS